jgi:hypothetical protein
MRLDPLDRFSFALIDLSIIKRNQLQQVNPFVRKSHRESLGGFLLNINEMRMPGLKKDMTQ